MVTEVYMYVWVVGRGMYKKWWVHDISTVLCWGDKGVGLRIWSLGITKLWCEFCWPKCQQAIEYSMKHTHRT